MSRARYEVPMHDINAIQNNAQTFLSMADTSSINILRTISSLSVKQRPSIAEGTCESEIPIIIIFLRVVAFLGFAMQAKFDIFTNTGEQILHAVEGFITERKYYKNYDNHE